MLKQAILFVCLLLDFTVHCASAHSSYGRCSQVYCVSDDVEDATPQFKVIEGRTGKSGPIGPKGDHGEPGIVNYTEIDENMMIKFQEIEERMNSKLTKYEELINASMAQRQEDILEIEERIDSKLAKYEELMNASKIQTKEDISELEERIDSKLAKYEELMNASKIQNKEDISEFKSNMSSKMSELEKELRKKQENPGWNCDNVCNEIRDGIRPNQPVGFATVGSVAEIYPKRFGVSGEVYCDCSSGSGGAWTVFQRRMDGSADFYRGWDDYVQGFGNKMGEFWLGLEAISELASDSTQYELRIDLGSWENEERYAQYSSFSVGGASTKYTLTIGGFSGDAGNSMILGRDLNGMQFSTKDSDHDRDSRNCAEYYTGAWWFNNCAYSKLNGKYYQRGQQPLIWHGVLWYDWKGHTYSMKSAEMKLRRKSG